MINFATLVCYSYLSNFNLWLFFVLHNHLSVARSEILRARGKVLSEDEIVSLPLRRRLFRLAGISTSIIMQDMESSL